VLVNGLTPPNDHVVVAAPPMEKIGLVSEPPVKLDRPTPSPLPSAVIVVSVAVTRPPASHTVAGRIVRLNVSVNAAPVSDMPKKLPPETLWPPAFTTESTRRISAPALLLVSCPPWETLKVPQHDAVTPETVVSVLATASRRYASPRSRIDGEARLGERRRVSTLPAELSAVWSRTINGVASVFVTVAPSAMNRFVLTFTPTVPLDTVAFTARISEPESVSDGAGLPAAVVATTTPVP
jgi:hypothetical protein